MKKAFFAAVVVILVFNYSHIDAMFFNKFLNHTNAKAQTCKIDFSIDENSTEKREIKFDELLSEQESFVGVDFDVTNNRECDIFIRIAVFPIVVDENNPNIAYKLSNSSCKIQYLNDDSNILNSTYWEKSSDGYYYYKKSMKEGDSLENRLISGIKLNLTKGE
ncbi:MAG: hypothetical protein ACI3VR_07435, partial [Intestinibacter sp.]|uniref:hypothetical protein n=1 Tax=Intestinibacter sp. TaxID=1965304 RepID=UPI003F158234